MRMTSSNRNRPVYLNLLRIRQPAAAVVSILHRISGLLLVLALPGLFFLLQRSLESEAGYAEVRSLFAGTMGWLAIAGLTWLGVEHLLSGLRHLLLDVDIGISRAAAKRSAWLVLAASAVITLWLVA